MEFHCSSCPESVVVNSKEIKNRVPDNIEEFLLSSETISDDLPYEISDLIELISSQKPDWTCFIKEEKLIVTCPKCSGKESQNPANINDVLISINLNLLRIQATLDEQTKILKLLQGRS